MFLRKIVDNHFEKLERLTVCSYVFDGCYQASVFQTITKYQEWKLKTQKRALKKFLKQYKSMF